MLIRWHFDFNLTDTGFALKEVSLKQLLVSSYRKELYKETLSLQQQKIKKAIAKSKLIFLQRCINRNCTPKSFQLKSPTKTKNTFNIKKEYSRKLTVVPKNGAKPTNAQSMNKSKTNLCELKRSTKDVYFALIDRITEISKEKEFTKKKKHLINRFEILKNSTGKKSKQKITYIKQAVINLTDTKGTE